MPFHETTGYYENYVFHNPRIKHKLHSCPAYPYKPKRNLTFLCATSKIRNQTQATIAAGGTNKVGCGPLGTSYRCDIKPTLR